MTFLPSLAICITILFGICVQILLLDIRTKDLRGKRRVFFWVGNILVLAVNTVLSVLLSTAQYMQMYVFVVHVPIFFVFWITTKISPIKIIFALSTAVFLIYPANFILTIVYRTFKGINPIGLFILYIAICAVILLIIYRFFKVNFNYLVKNYNGAGFVKLCLLPLAYYIANYWLGLYNFQTINITQNFSLRLLVFLITLIAYVLILDIAKFTREKEELQGVQNALFFRLKSAEQQLSAMKATQEQAMVYRHDMRHHLAMIGGYLADGDMEKAEKYVRLVQADIEKITPNRYCENNTVNLILSYFAMRAKKRGVIFSVDAQLSQELSISETELCALLSNGLENAIEATAQVADEQFRKVRISCKTHKGNLLILIENSFTGKLVVENDIPQNRKEGHGYGIKSMSMIAEKYNGYCSFETKGEVFIIRIVLPL